MIDKVKMSLERYDRMKRKIADAEKDKDILNKRIKHLESECKGYKTIIQKIGIPGEIIDCFSPDDIETMLHHDPMGMHYLMVIKIKNIPPEYLHDF